MDRGTTLSPSVRPGPGLVSSSVLTSVGHPALGWPDTHSGLGDGHHPRGTVAGEGAGASEGRRSLHLGPAQMVA